MRGSLNSQGDRALESTERNRQSLYFINLKNSTALKAAICLNKKKKNPMAAMKTPRNPNPR